MRILNRSAGRLSRHRRGPLAGLVVMMIGLLLTGGLYAALSPASATKTSAVADEALIEEGRELFLVGCAFCHGKNGEGISTQDGGQYGPSLIGVGAASVDFQVGTGRMPMVQPGQQALEKEKVYTEREIEALAAFVASLGPGPAIPTEDEYTLEGLTDDERREAIVNGGQLFLTNCSACHNFEGSGGAMPQGKVAVSLRETEPKYLYEAMLTGPQQMPVFPNSVLTPEDKASIIAFMNSTVENPDYGGFELGGLGPVSEGLFAWLVGIGSLVGFAYWIAAHTARSKKQETHS